MDTEFHDWEVVSDPEDVTHPVSVSDPVSEPDPEGIFLPDHFSLKSGIQNPNFAAENSQENPTFVEPNPSLVAAGDGDNVSVGSDNPSWIDPGSVVISAKNDVFESWPDSSSDKSNDSGENMSSQAEFGENSELGDVGSPKSMGSGEEKVVMDGGNGENVEKEAIEAGAEGVGVGKPVGGAQGVAWWKVPLDLVKYCVFKCSPVWSISVAAAVMGCLILGRRLYRMRRKSHGLQLKVTVDDKKVSQFMSRAARLNEAFSIVKRVPIVRPPMPASGVTPWPMMSLR